MTIRPHRVVALILAIAALTLNVFPRIQRRDGPPSLQSRADFREGTTTAVSLSASCGFQNRLPLAFETNRGQADADVRFVGRGDGLALLLKPNEAVFSLRKPQRISARGAAPIKKHQLNDTPESAVLRMKLEGAKPMPVIAGKAAPQVRANYFIGNDPAKWIRGVETYSRVLYSGVYDGVDLVFYGRDRTFEYDFTVAPGADPQQIRLRFDGAEYLELTADGALILHTAAGAVRQEPPVAYQETGGSRIEAHAAFKRLDKGLIGFEVGGYDPGRPLVIDPILVYSSYLGGSIADNSSGIMVDSLGNAYFGGDSFSSNFLHNASAENSDVFVGRLGPLGSLTYSFFGGSKNDSATGLARDSSGNLYLCGITESPDFPNISSVGLTLLGASDAFVVRLTPELDQFSYSSLVGGSGEEAGVSIAADSDGSAYITGRTTSQDFPTVGAIQPIYGGGHSDAFVTKLSPGGNSLMYSSFLGGSGSENLNGKTGISVDSSGNACVVGDTDSSDFPTKDAIRPTKTGQSSNVDGYVAKINSSGSDFVYATYLGGNGTDFALAVATDSEGSAYVAGGTNSTSFTGSASTRPSASASDAFVAKLDGSGTTISYLTFVGGAGGEDWANAIAVDSGNAVIAGRAGEQLPAINSVQSFFKGGALEGDAFVAKLGPGGAVTFSTYLGGSHDDAAQSVTVGADGLIYLAGFTTSTDFLTARPLQRENAGGQDIFIAKIDPNSNPDDPVLLQAVISGKHLILYGQGFDAGAKLRVNDQQVKTRNENPDTTQILFAKKAAKRIPAGAFVQLQIQNASGKRSNFLLFRKPE